MCNVALNKQTKKKRKSGICSPQRKPVIDLWQVEKWLKDQASRQIFTLCIVDCQMPQVYQSSQEKKQKKKHCYPEAWPLLLW